ncbi:MAG: hypothetical protein HOB20_00600, partial [Planctomycetaceae bacterium]|nr:hypothetical protein [Planctomycetaceae bacterium]
VESLNLSLGQSRDTLLVNTTHAAPTNISANDGDDILQIEEINDNTIVDTGRGSDLVRIGSSASALDEAVRLSASTVHDAVRSRLELHAGTGLWDQVVVYDSGAQAGRAGAIQSQKITGLGMAGEIIYQDFDFARVILGNQGNAFHVQSTHAGQTEIDTGTGADTVNVQATTGVTYVNTEQGNDVVNVNYDAQGQQTFLAGIGDDSLIVRTGFGSDHINVGLSGNASSLIDIFDTYELSAKAALKLATADSLHPVVPVTRGTPPADEGLDSLNIYGTDEADYFLIRANNVLNAGLTSSENIGIIAAIQTDSLRQPIEGGTTERINYRSDIDGGITTFGRSGNDTFVFDDTKSSMVVYGDEGNDTFQIGQIFQSARDGSNPDNNLATDEWVATTQVTRGFLTNGVSHSTTIYGGTGEDSFNVYRNLAELFLFGQEDDDNFLIRAFVKVNPNDPKAPFTNINGGQGADFIAYTVNAPVRISGGSGFDTLTVVGTEFGDDFVITRDGIFGGGLYVTYGAIEKVDVDALEGNDTFFVESSSENVVLEIFGGIGSDVFNISGGSGNAPITVASNGLDGHTGLIQHQASSTFIETGSAGLYQDVYVRDLDVKVADSDEAGIVITPISEHLRVFEDVRFDDPGVDHLAAKFIRNSYQVVLTRAPKETVRVAAFPTALSEKLANAGGKNLILNGSSSGTNLYFDRTNWFIPQTVTITAHRDSLGADDDNFAQGNRSVVIQHTVTEGVTAEDLSEYDNLAVLSVTVDVIDNESTSLIVSPANESLIVSENGNSNNNLPGTDTYYVTLSRQVANDVTVTLPHDPLQLSLNTGHSGPAPLLFSADTSDGRPSIHTVNLSAQQDGLPEGYHFSRIS